MAEGSEAQSATAYASCGHPNHGRRDHDCAPFVDEVPCNADIPHAAHLWTFADDHPLMHCRGVPTLAEAIAKTLCEFDCGGDGSPSPCKPCQDEARSVVPTIIEWYAGQGIDLLEFRG